MGINFTDLDRKALAVFGYSSTDPVIPTSVREEQANYALYDLADMADWPWLYKEETLTISAGINFHQIGATFAALKVLWLAQEDRLLKYLTVPQFQRISGDATQTGTPVYWTTKFGGTNRRIEFAPTSATQEQFTLAFKDSPTLLSSASPSTETEVPTEIEEAFVLMVARRLARVKGRDEDVARADRDIRDLTKDYGQYRYDSAALPSVRVRKDWPHR